MSSIGVIIRSSELTWTQNVRPPELLSSSVTFSDSCHVKFTRLDLPLGCWCRGDICSERKGSRDWHSVVKIRELADDSGVINTLPGQTSSTMSKV